MLLSQQFSSCLTQQPQVSGDAAKGVQVADENAAIQSTAIAFAEAFNRADVKAIAALWTANGEYVDESGSSYEGRDLIEKRYSDSFEAKPEATIALDIDSVRLASPHVGIEDGRAALTLPAGGDSTSSPYSVVPVKVAERWLMIAVT